MKKAFIIGNFLLMSLLGKGQYAYQDAVRIVDLYENNKPEKIIELLVKNNYYSNNGIVNILQNPFLKDFVTAEIEKMKKDGKIVDNQPLKNGKIPKFKQYDFNNASIGGASSGDLTTSVILGFVDFVIERANEELVLNFLQKFKNLLNIQPYKDVIESILPISYHYIINDFQPINISRDLQIIKQNLKSDLNAIDVNYKRLFHSSLFDKISKDDNNIKLVFDFLETCPYFFNSNNTPFDITVNKIFSKTLNNNSTSNLYGILQVLGYFSLAISDAESNVWIDHLDLSNPDVSKVFLGLLIANISKIQFNNMHDSLQVEKIANKIEISKKKLDKGDVGLKKRLFKRSIKSDNNEILESDTNTGLINIEFSNLNSKLDTFKILFPEICRLAQIYSNLRKFEFENALDRSKQEVVLFNNFFITIDKLLELLEIKGNANLKKKINQVRNIFYNSAMLNINLKEQEFTSAFMNISNILSSAGLTFLPNEKILSYTTFLADISQAKNPSDVKNILKNNALPVGSSAIKKNSVFSIGIQSYLGLGIGYEQGHSICGSATFGLDLPVGIDFSWGLPSKSSCTLFLSIFNLGSIADVRLSKNSEIKPDTKLTVRSILAPGISYVHGLKNYPISFSIGAEYRPYYRNYKLDTENQRSVCQIKLKALVDIPIFLINRN